MTGDTGMDYTSSSVSRLHSEDSGHHALCSILTSSGTNTRRRFTFSTHMKLHDTFLENASEYVENEQELGWGQGMLF